MCEHAGMLNHLYAKIDDLEIHEGDVVAQVAPQSFDISLWQLVSALLVGGRTLIVEQELILDMEAFVETIAGSRVNVLQVVPSYLEALLSYMEEYPRELPDLRCVSVTGEPVKRALLRRWFAFAPGIKVMNAYGLTETSDDTNHEVMAEAPDSDRVPLGPRSTTSASTSSTSTSSPVPLGAPGEIVFSGVCVGRGYINDPERTRLAFVADPHSRASACIAAATTAAGGPTASSSSSAAATIRSRSGAIGSRSARSRAPSRGSRVSGPPPWSSPREPRAASGWSGSMSARLMRRTYLRKALAESLPSYMIPSAFHRRDALPLTANGKVDQKALIRLAEQGDAR